MKRHTLSSTGLPVDCSTSVYNRSCTPAEMKFNRGVLPGISDEGCFGKLNFSSEKKYSILNVPKVRIRENRIFRQLSNDFKYVIENTESVSRIEKKKKVILKEKISLGKEGNIKRTYRHRRIVGNENIRIHEDRGNRIKLESERFFDRTEVHEKKNTKSDIEEILESQEYLKNYKKKWKKPGIFINLSNKGQEIEKDARVDDSVISDPSPVKEIANEKQSPKSKTPTTSNNIFISNVPSILILSETKVGKAILEKLQESKNRILKKPIRQTSPNQDFIEKQIINYKQESLKVLKNTAFLADKIMKDIRCGQRKKTSMYNN
ncbi:hypothetical protein SteCoe_3171 [Stentor coeruleus]|uniref:Uncharacterized protein n=1 Tax=Stentor coeruleus TaxID=5963 RepID=A0A1R2CXY3_9CILI|nr:hypothetical protein SteCoe_3171 [Stentor coeruleus]